MNQRQASPTALLILRSLVMQAHDPVRKPLIPSSWGEPHEKLLCLVDPAGPRWIEDSKKAGFRKQQYVREKMFMPGIHAHYILRKRFIESLAHECITREDFTQVVNIGAGYDSLCYRLHWEFPSVNFFELDHPATQGAKQRALSALGHSTSLALLPIDLDRAVLDNTLLAEPAYDRNARTLFIAEGLFMYLSAKVIKNLFDTIYSHSGPSSCIAFTFIEDTKPPGTSPFLRWWLKHKDEPFTWAMPREKMDDFIEAHLLDLDQIVDSDALRKTYASPFGLDHIPATRSEHIAVATRP